MRIGIDTRSSIFPMRKHHHLTLSCHDDAADKDRLVLTPLSRRSASLVTVLNQEQPFALILSGGKK
jgi:hypothetical protein